MHLRRAASLHAFSQSKDQVEQQTIFQTLNIALLFMFLYWNWFTWACELKILHVNYLGQPSTTEFSSRLVVVNLSD